MRFARASALRSGRAAPPLQSGPGIGRGRAGGRSGAVGGARGVRGAARARPRGTVRASPGITGARERALGFPRRRGKKKSHAREGTRGRAGDRGRARAGTHHTLPSRICVSVDAERDAAGETAGASARRETARRSIALEPARVQKSRRGVGRAARTNHPGGNESRQRDLTSRSQVSRSRGETVSCGFSSVLTTLRRTRGARRPSSSLHFRASAICFSTTGRSSGHAAA